MNEDVKGVIIVFADGTVMNLLVKGTHSQLELCQDVCQFLSYQGKDQIKQLKVVEHIAA